MVSMGTMLASGLMFTALLPGQEKRLTFEVTSIKPTGTDGVLRRQAGQLNCSLQGTATLLGADRE
jgi:hypothetical protein